MILPNQIRRGVVVITVDNEKFIVDDYDDGTNNPVGHFAVHCVKHEGDMNGKWIGSEKIKSVKRTNIKEPVRTTDMAISQWQNFGPKTLTENINDMSKYVCGTNNKNPKYQIFVVANKNNVNQWETNSLHDAEKSIDIFFNTEKLPRTVANIYKIERLNLTNIEKRKFIKQGKLLRKLHFIKSINKKTDENTMKTFKQLLKESAGKPRIFKIEFTSDGEKLMNRVWAEYIDYAIEKLKKKYDNVIISRYSFDQEKQNKSDADIK